MALPALLRRHGSAPEVAPESGHDAGGEVTRSVATRVVRVNLLPGEVREARTLRRVQAVVLAVAVGVVAVVGTGWWYEHHTLTSARADQAAAQTRHDGLSRQVSQLQPVDKLFKQVDQARAMLATASSNNVGMSELIVEISSHLPPNTWLTSATVGAGNTNAAATPSAGAAPSSTATAAGGLVTLAGNASSMDSVADLIDALSGVPALASVYPTSLDASTAGKGKIVLWNITAALTPQALLAVKGGPAS